LAIRLNRSHRTGGFRGTNRVRPPTLLVRLEFIPNEHERFAADHPALEEYLGRQDVHGGYRFPLGPDQQDKGASVNAATGVFAQGRYNGIIVVGATGADTQVLIGQNVSLCASHVLISPRTLA